MKRKMFTIPSLIAAGIFSGSTSAEEAKSPETSIVEDISEIVSSISDEHKYTLAAHRSHGSHHSHQSHHSHMAPQPAPSPELKSIDEVGQSNIVSTRNERSTPRSSVLPRSFGTLKKVKVLPGNTPKFRNIVLRVQLGLYGLGYEVGPVNGNLHANTVAALYKYQKDKGMIPSGKITHEVLDLLRIVAQ